MRILSYLVLISLFGAPTVALAQSDPPSESICAVLKAPAKYNGAALTLRAVVTSPSGGGNFFLGSEDCADLPLISITFGDDLLGPPEIHGNRPFLSNENLRKLFALIAVRTRDGSQFYKVTATFTGQFLSGKSSYQTEKGVTHFVLDMSGVDDIESTPKADLSLSGTLLTRDEKPAQGVRVINEGAVCCLLGPHDAVTDKEGHFALTDAGQVLHFRRDDMRPLTIVTDPGSTTVRAMLSPSKNSDWVIPACTAANKGEGRLGYGITVLVPPSLKATPVQDMDGMWLLPANGRSKMPLMTIAHNHTDVSELLPSSDAIVDSIWFKQRWVKDTRGKVVGIDVWGHDKIEGPWHTSLFLNGDEFSYGGFSEIYQGRFRNYLIEGSEKQLLDQILSTACILK